jgi:pimeloyl-ACP methyl ester carboxylesterase
MPVVEGAGVELAYEEAGTGPALVLVHGMADDRAAWPAEIPGLRTIAYDRRGYGESSAPEPYDRTTVAEQAEDLAALVRALGAAPAIAAGADLGALVVLDVLKRHAGALSAAVLVDPPVFQLVPEALEPLAAERLMLEDALRDGGRERAVEAWLAARGATDADRLARARRDARAFFADYGGQATLPLSRGDLRAIAVPVAVLDSPRAAAHARAASDAVARLVPGARRGGAEDVADAVAGLLG